MKKNIILITSRAVTRIKQIIVNDKNNPIGIGIKIETGCCSGSKYKFYYVYNKQNTDEEVLYNGIRIFIHSNAILKIFGTTLDYVDQKVKSGFIFINPNEKGKCGCGESVLL